MLASQFIQTNYPVVHLYDKISHVLQLMDDYDVQHLPVLQEDKFVGLIGKDDAFDADENNAVASLEYQLVKASVKTDSHFTHALKLAADMHLSVIPVINEQQELTGIISLQDLVKAISLFVGNEEPGAIIVLEIDKRNYSFGEINRLVETNDAHITQLNTHIDAETGSVIVTIKISKQEISEVVATFQRYDYHVRYYFGDEHFANEMKDNFQNLLSYLNI
jgi:acetoin utilization protein AcuB